MTSLQEQYQAERRQISASGIYRPPAPASAAPSRYTENAYQGLGGYQSASADKLDRQAGESTENWRRRVQSVIRHLPEDEAQARLAAIDEAEAPQNHQQLRAHLAGRQGTGTGILGNGTPQDRAAILGGRGFGERPIEANGHVMGDTISGVMPLTMAEINQIRWAREAEQRGQEPQRQEIPTGSSGNGWMVR